MVGWKDFKQIGLESRNTQTIAAVILVSALALGAFSIYDSNRTIENSGEEFNRNDVMFMNMMIVHHDQAIEMAELAENRTENENIIELSNNISNAQREENRQMAEWMKKLGYSSSNHHPVAGMASEREMQQLRNSNGSEFNQLFAELMITHHEGGIAMAQNFRQNGQNQELKQMQQQMIDTQTEEIQKMEEWQREDQL